MSFSTVINLGTVSAAITQVKLYECTGNNTGCTGLTGYTAVDVNTFPITVTGITDNMEYIKVEALGTCAGTIQSLVISGKPGTPTPTPTATGTPTPTPTATPTVTPTPTPTTNCVTSVQFEVVTGGDVRYVDCCGNTEYANVGAGPEVINGCIQNGSLFQVGASITDISYGGSPCSCDATPTPTPTVTPLPPVAEFSLAYGTNTSSSGTGTSTFTPTITVTNGTALIRLTVKVETGYQADATITITGGGSYSPTAASGSGNTSFVEFNLPIGVYNTTWTVSAISQGEMTVASSTLTQQ